MKIAKDENRKILSGIITICAQCKKIRDEAGQWHNPEEYSNDYSNADFSHGYCPKCGAEAMELVRGYKIENE